MLINRTDFSLPAWSAEEVSELNILGMFANEITENIASGGLEKYRGEQIAKWIYQQGVHDFQAMTNIPIDKRQFLSANYNIGMPSTMASQQSSDNKTSKYLLAFADGAAVETVLMRQSYGNSVCVSTQVGCAMGCSFCASTLNGVMRNLSGGEILAQVLFINKILASEKSSVNTIVLMGSGEPLANYDNVLRFIRLCHERYCLNLGFRNITLSTAGVVPGIHALANEGIPINLAISLHAPTNQLRSKLMPINNKYPIETVVEAADYYADKTGRRVTYEYTLIADINDSPKHAAELAKLLRGRLANVNLIPVNPVPERGLLRPSRERVNTFLQVLQSCHTAVTIRREMGSDIQAACGQLRKNVLTNVGECLQD